MYYVDQDQIRARLEFIPTIVETLRSLAAQEDNTSLIAHFAQERALHLGIEVVTDVGSLLIDGFMMRNASSYEDIVVVLTGEGVLPAETAEGLKSLITLRRPLTQTYMELDRSVPLRGDLETVAQLLESFPAFVNAFIDKELQPFV